MSHKHLHLLQAIYHDPLSANIHWREIESLLLHLGATIESAHGARFRIVLNKVEVFLHHPHNRSPHRCINSRRRCNRSARLYAASTLSLALCASAASIAADHASPNSSLRIVEKLARQPCGTCRPRYPART